MASPDRPCQSSATVTPNVRMADNSSSSLYSTPTQQEEKEDSNQQDHDEPDEEQQSVVYIPFSEISENDVLCGRGAGTNRHVGNKKFRKLVQMNHEAYFHAKVLDKSSIAAKIVEIIRRQNPPGRFLKASEHSNSNEGANKHETCWYEIGDRAAKDKTSQALRERTPEDRKRQDSFSRDCSTPSLEHGNPYGSQTSSPLQQRHHHHGEYLQLPLLDHDASSSDKTLTSTTAKSNDEITDNDVLCGRGGVTNCHTGNRRFRELVRAHQPSYLSAPKMEKAKIAKRIVGLIRHAQPPGRFLQQSKKDGSWSDIGDLKAREKASQALREKAPEARIVFSAAADLIKTKEGRPSSSDRKWPSLPSETQAVQERDECAGKRSRSISPPPTPYMSTPTPPSFPPSRHVYHSHHVSYEGSPYSHQSCPGQLSIEHSPQRHTSTGAFYLPHGAESADSYYREDQMYSEVRYSHFPHREYHRGVVHRISSHELNEFDVLLGRGAGVNFHPGNLRFRDIVQHHRGVYSQAQKLEKSSIAQYIVDQVRRHSGRFLVKDADDDELWIEVDEDRAREKTSQALREKVSDSPKRKFEPRPHMLYHSYHPSAAVSQAQAEAEEHHLYPKSGISHIPHYSYVPHASWHAAPGQYVGESSPPLHYGGYYPKRRRIHNQAM